MAFKTHCTKCWTRLITQTHFVLIFFERVGALCASSVSFCVCMPLVFGRCFVTWGWALNSVITREFNYQKLWGKVWRKKKKTWLNNKNHNDQSVTDIVGHPWKTNITAACYVIRQVWQAGNTQMYTTCTNAYKHTSAYTATSYCTKLTVTQQSCSSQGGSTTALWRNTDGRLMWCKKKHGIGGWSSRYQNQ
jgi:hypothetical protein